MQEYAIRIVRASDRSQIVVTASLFGDHAAIRRAQMLAAVNDVVEVWRGMICIYSTVPEHAYAH